MYGLNSDFQKRDVAIYARVFCRTQVYNWHSGKSMDCLIKLCGQRAEKLGCFFPASKCRKYLNECIQRNE